MRRSLHWLALKYEGVNKEESTDTRFRSRGSVGAPRGEGAWPEHHLGSPKQRHRVTLSTYEIRDYLIRLALFIPFCTLPTYTSSNCGLKVWPHGRSQPLTQLNEDASNRPVYQPQLPSITSETATNRRKLRNRVLMPYSG